MEAKSSWLNEVSQIKPLASMSDESFPDPSFWFQVVICSTKDYVWDEISLNGEIFPIFLFSRWKDDPDGCDLGKLLINWFVYGIFFQVNMF